MSHERYNVENENHNGKTVIDVPYREVRSRQHQTFGANGRNQGKRNKREKNRAGKYVKRMGMLAMSAVMFGALAAGSFQGVHYLTGYETAQQSEEQEKPTANLVRTSADSSADSEAQDGKSGLDVSDIAQAAMPSIVSITGKTVEEVQGYYNGYIFNQIQPEESVSYGSGVIIGQTDTELLILTNNHVVAEADTLSVGFADNSVYEAAVKGRDENSDLAVIAVPVENISQDTLSAIAVAVVGNSDDLAVGEQVVAIGNALGYGQSVTTGIVSATNRVIGTSSAGWQESSGTAYIQTDAAINPGNSGGALLNMKGELIGINSAKLASTDVEGMGYAIPISQVSDIIENLMNQTTRTQVDATEQGYLGISGESVTEAIAAMYGMPQGVFISDVTSDMAASNAGIESGSILTSFDGTQITSTQQLKKLLQYYRAGETVEVTLQVPGADGYEEKTLTVTLSPTVTNNGGQMA